MKNMTKAKKKPELPPAAEAGRSYLEQGRFALACDAFAHVLQGPGGIDEEIVLLYARALRSMSRYDEAENLLLLAQKTAETEAQSLGERAELAWLRHRYREGYDLAIASLRLNMFNKRVEVTRDRCRDALAAAERPDDRPSGGQGGRSLGHAAFYVAPGGNFGDLALPSAVRMSVEAAGPVDRWVPYHVHQQFDDERVAEVNALDGLIIGGGGLFLPDTAANGDSGWQWNVARERLKAIETPIGVAAVGYNLFKGQRFSGDLFQKSLRTLVERAQMVGLRNHGSIERVRALLPAPLADKVTYFPCPTTVLGLMRGDDPPRRGADPDGPLVFLNAAFDRSAMRFADAYATFLDGMARYVSNLRQAGARVEFAAHLPGDEKLIRDLKSAYGVRIRPHGFYDMTCDEGYALYRTADLVVGMRGHATMIPFGLGVPVLSIVSHPKMRFFLEDIDRADWGVDVTDPHFSDLLFERSMMILDDNAAVRDDVRTLQGDLLKAVQAALSRMTFRS